MEKEKQYHKIGILEFDEQRMGVKCGKTEALFIILAVAALLLFVFVIRIPGLGVDASYAAGILLFLALLYICKAIDNGIVVILGFIVVYFLKVMDVPTLFSQIGNSAVTMLLPMLILAYSVTNTNVGQRMTLLIVRKLGKSPAGLVYAFAFASTILSAFIINWPVIIMLTPIARTVLIELGEAPGKRSKLGCAIYASILLGSTIGGASLVCGSSVNPSIIALIGTCTNGEMTVDFLQWAAVGVPTAIVTVPICTWIINKCCGINKNLPVKALDMEDIERQINDLGKVQPSEIRFLLTIVLLVALFVTSSLTGINMIMCTMIASALCCIPGWGVNDAKKAFQSAHWEVILVTIGVQLQGALAIQTGLGEWLVEQFLGWTVGYPLYVLVLAAAIAYAVVTFLTTTIPYAIIIPGLIPICVATGVTPMAPIMAIAMIQAYFTHTPWHSAPQLVYSDGYWDYKDFLKVGWITLVALAALIALVCTVIAPMIFA